MSVKKDLLKEIDKKAQKIRDKRIEAANNKTLEDATFDFFRNIELLRLPDGSGGYESTLFKRARQSLTERIRGYDSGAKVSIEYDRLENGKQVRGVTIWWSNAYIGKYSVAPSYYIDVSQMLFL